MDVRVVHRFWLYGVFLVIFVWGLLASPSEVSPTIVVVTEVPETVVMEPTMQDSIPANEITEVPVVQAPLRISINTADAKTLDKLPGIGEVLAERIVLSRNQLGPFTSVDDLQRVEGIGKKKCALIAQHVIIE